MSDFTNGIEADFWDDDPDTDRLSRRSLAAAVAVFVEQECGRPGAGPFLDCLRVLDRRSFFAWKRGTVSWELINSTATDLADRAVTYGLEEVVDPEGLRASDKLLQKRLELAFGNVLRDELLHGQWKPWHCEQIGQVTLTAVQMEALMREHNPHWFAESA